MYKFNIKRYNYTFYTLYTAHHDSHWKYNENLTTSPVAAMVYVVQGRLYSVCTVYKPHGCRRLNHRDGVWDRLTSFDALITGDELDSAKGLSTAERSISPW